MNPLDQIRNLVAQPSTNTTGTVVGMQGSLVQLRTSKGIQLVNSSTFAPKDSSMTIDSKGNTVSVADPDHAIPEWQV